MSPVRAEGPRTELLSGWGRTAPTLATLVDPGCVEDIADRLHHAGPRGAIARGLGRAYGDAAQNAGGDVLRCTRLVGPWHLDDATATLTVGAGTSLGLVCRRALARGLLPPVLPGTGHVTVGGAIAADVHGKNHASTGSFADHVAGLTLVTPGAGVLEVDSEHRPALFRATAGGMGLTGVIARATLRLRRVETAWMWVRERRARDLDAVLDGLEGESDPGAHVVAWIDGLARGATLGRGVVTRAVHARVSDLPAAAAERPLDAPRDPVRRLPAWAALPVRAAAVATINAGHLRRSPDHGDRLVPAWRALMPLDGVAGWNRIVRGGFVQYQFVAPRSEPGLLATVLEHVARGPAAPFLVSLRRLGGRGEMLSFPIDGWALAIDLPAVVPGLAPLLDELDARVAAAGGRVYLAKDARLRPGPLREMYPGLSVWNAERTRVDPDGVLRSDLARRLELGDRT